MRAAVPLPSGGESKAEGATEMTTGTMPLPSGGTNKGTEEETPRAAVAEEEAARG